MTKKSHKNISKTIAKNIAAWDESKTVAEFFKKKLCQNGNADRIANNIIEKSLIEEKPEWTRLLIDSMKTPEDKQPLPSTPINFFTIASGQIDSAVQTLIDVTPKNNSKKKGIEALI
jgi:hypothetical protein